MREFVASDGNLLNTALHKKKKSNKSKNKKLPENSLKDESADLLTISSKDISKQTDKIVDINKLQNEKKTKQNEEPPTN
jgi:hypothetical protein